MAISPETMRRLAFVKHLFTVASQQAGGAELTSAAAVLSLHDAVELFLVAASDQHNVPVSSKAGFEDYWAPLAGAVGVQRLPTHTAMRRLNAARVAIKHKGVLPSKVDISAFQTTVASFFEDAFPLLFGVDFRAVSLIEFVEPDAARKKLQEAGASMGLQDYGAALVHIAVALEMLLQHYREPHPRRGNSPLKFGRDVSSTLSLSRVGRGDPDLNRTIQEIGSAVQAMQGALRIIAMGLDFRRYLHFKSIVPSVSISGGGRVYAGRSNFNATEADAMFCFEYVVDCAITLARGPRQNTTP